MPNEVLEIEFPVSARELETKLHAYCDHHGWDVEVKPVFREIAILGCRNRMIDGYGNQDQVRDR